MTETLVSLGALDQDRYTARTGDSTTAASAVTAALVEGESLLEEELDRLLALDERDERMRIRDRLGRMYPRAWPITACASNTIENNRTLLGGVPDVAQFVALIDSKLPNYATVTYTGGFDDDTLPVTLADAIYDLAHARLTTTGPALSGTSASVGDVSISGIDSSTEGSLDSYVPGLLERVAKYRNRHL